MADKGFDGPMLIDTGTKDQFIDLLRPEALAGCHCRAPPTGHVPDAAGL